MYEFLWNVMSKGGMEIWHSIVRVHSIVRDWSPPSERHVIPYYYAITLWRSVSWTTFVPLNGICTTVQPADWWTTSGNVVNVTWRLSLYLEHVRQRGAWRYSAVWYTHLSRKVLYEIKGSHDALQCLPWSVVCLAVLHFIVDSVWICYSLRLEQETPTVGMTLCSTSLFWSDSLWRWEWD